MPQPTNSIQLHRVLRAPAKVVYEAFLHADALVKWLPPYGFTGQIHEMNASVGGRYKMSFINFRTGTQHSFGGVYQELIPNKKIRYSDQFDDPSLSGEILVTITLNPVQCGTEIHILQENLPAFIPTAQCYLGWQESLTQLALLVEANIPDAPL